MAYMINKIENEENEIIKDISGTNMIDGEITYDGIEVDDKLIVERQKERTFKDLNFEEYETLKRWSAQLNRDYPDCELWWCESIVYHAIKNPESAEKYANENKNKLFQSKGVSKKYFKNLEKENPHIKMENNDDNVDENLGLIK